MTDIENMIREEWNKKNHEKLRLTISEYQEWLDELGVGPLTYFRDGYLVAHRKAAAQIECKEEGAQFARDQADKYCCELNAAVDQINEKDAEIERLKGWIAKLCVAGKISGVSEEAAEAYIEELKGAVVNYSAIAHANKLRADELDNQFAVVATQLKEFEELLIKLVRPV